MLPSYEIGQNQYAWGENVFTRGGVPQTRPGNRYVTELPGKKLQGMVMFTPTNASQQMIVAIDGEIFQSSPPFTSFAKVQGANFSPCVDMIHMKPCLKSVEETLSGVLSLITPKSMIVIQDGISPAVSWDGGTAKTLDIPIGTWMEWANSRLWIANGSSLIAGNLGDPEHATENQYLAERSDFTLPDYITGMIQTTDLQGLLVFTATTTFAFQTGIRDRKQWQTTPNFQSLAIPHVGCVAGRSIVNQYGLTHWFSASGMVTANAAMASKISSSLPSIDGEMTRSKANISSNPSGVCCATYENVMMVSVPSGDRYNSHTWIKDFAPSGESNGVGANPYTGTVAPGAWAGVWTGIRPVQWATSSDNGRQRCFAACYDKSSKNGKLIHIWEAFSSVKTDNNGGRITCALETAMVMQPTRRKFCYSEIDVCEITGIVDLEIYFGGLKGPWIKIFDGVLQAMEGSMGSPGNQIMDENTVIQNFKPQSRRIRTRDFSPQTQAPIRESGDVAGADKAFALLFVWKGRMGIQRARIVTSDFPESNTGVPATIEATAYAIDAGGAQI